MLNAIKWLNDIFLISQPFDCFEHAKYGTHVNSSRILNQWLFLFNQLQAMMPVVVIFVHLVYYDC